MLRRISAVIVVWWVLVMAATTCQALPAKLGDLDEDGVATILDVAKLAAHFRGTHPLSREVALFADMNQDGVLNEADQEALAEEILQLATPRDLPLTTIRETSPALGEADVAVTRETILYFAHPLSPFTSIDTTRFHADFGGRKVLSCVQLASDRKKVTLFYLEPLPSNARVVVTFDGNGLNDLIGRPIDADGDGQPGGVYTTEFETISITPVPNTGIVGQVLASERATGGAEVPLAGVTIVVDGAEETLRCVTDADGRFALTPCPSGLFFVHIDGRTSPESSYPSGNYYPSVGKKWFAQPGRLDNPAGDIDDTPEGGGTGVIYLPCVCAGTLVAVSPTEETVITFPESVLAANPELAGTELRVPANSLFADDGTRGGMVGIAPVAPDRLPSPLVPGFNPPFVFTVQSDGATNFDEPVPVCFPNLPDPDTGEILEPGAKSALISFNHDLGEWQIVGSMTVSDDGRCVTTDAGVGLRQPGWVLIAPGVLLSGRFEVTECETSDDWEGAIKNLAKVVGRGIGLRKAAYRFVNNVERSPFKLVGGVAFSSIGCVSTAYARANARGSFEIGDILSISCARAVLDILTIVATATGVGVAAVPVLQGISLTLRMISWQNSIFDAAESLFGAATPELSDCDPDFDNKLARLGEAAQEAGDAAAAIAGQLEFGLDFDQSVIDDAVEIMEGVVHRGESGSAEFLLWVLNTLKALSRVPEKVSSLTESCNRMEIAIGELSSAIALFDNIETRRGTGKIRYEIGDGPGIVGRIEGLSFSIIAPLDTDVRISGVSSSGLHVATFAIRTPDAEDERVRNTSSRVSIDLGVKPLRKLGRGALDSDDDGLPDLAEEAAGTDPLEADTDGDGISDLADLLSGSVLGLGEGAFATTKIAQGAGSIDANRNVIASTCGAGGTAFLIADGGLAPTMRTLLPTHSVASAVSLGFNSALISESEAGFRCVTLDDQLVVTRGYFTPVNGRAISTAAVGGIGYGGTSGGEVLEFDLASGAVLRQLATGVGDVEDLAVQGDWLLARKPDRLLAISLGGGEMVVEGEAVLSVGRTASLNRLRIAVGEGRVFCTKGDGCHIVDTTALPVMSVLSGVNGPGDNWRHFVPNGRVGVLAGKVQVTQNRFLRLPIPASLFTIPESADTVDFATSYDMPGFANSVAINRGVAYVACDNGTLAVVNYLDFDRNRVAPSITLDSNVDLAAASPEVIEGTTMRLSALVADDVQVGNVEFYVDGELSFDDGSYPFENRFLVPRRSAAKSSFTVQGRAFDTGGNATWSTEYTLALLPDTTPPLVTSVLPGGGSMNLVVDNLYVRFNEWMDAATLVAPGLRVSEAGGDEMFGTGDDVEVPYFLVYRDTDSLARLALSAPLGRGRYRVSVGTSVTDATGNEMAAAFVSEFRVFSLVDLDEDGLVDDWEELLGSDPTVADSDGNGILDGFEDRDGDGTPDGVEIVFLRQDPRVADANGNGVLDGFDDSDSDGFFDWEEAVAGTDHFNADTDGDGLDDGTEVAAGFDPLVSNASPTLSAGSGATALLNAIPEVTPVLEAGANSGSTALLNAIPEVTPVIATPAQSGATSFRNE